MIEANDRIAFFSGSSAQFSLIRPHRSQIPIRLSEGEAPPPLTLLSSLLLFNSPKATSVASSSSRPFVLLSLSLKIALAALYSTIENGRRRSGERFVFAAIRGTSKTSKGRTSKVNLNPFRRIIPGRTFELLQPLRKSFPDKFDALKNFWRSLLQRLFVRLTPTRVSYFVD